MDEEKRQVNRIRNGLPLFPKWFPAILLIGSLFIRPLSAETIHIDQQMRGDLEGVESILQEIQSIQDIAQARVKLQRHATEARLRWQSAQLEADEGKTPEEAYQESKQLADEMRERILSEVGRIRSLEGMTRPQWDSFESARTKAISDIMSAMEAAIDRRRRGVPPIAGSSTSSRSSNPQEPMADGHPITGPTLNVIVRAKFEGMITGTGLLESFKEIYPTRLEDWDMMSNEKDVTRVRLDPAVDASAVAKKIKFATVLKVDPATSTIEIELNDEQLKALAKRAEESLGTEQFTRMRRMYQGLDDHPAMPREAFDETAASDPKHPEFFAENLKRLRTGNHFDVESSIQQLRHAKPSDCADESVRKGIAETLLKLLEDDQLHGEAIAYRVVIQWCGKVGVQALIQRLKDVESPIEARELILAFSKVKSKSATQVIAPHLANFFTHEAAAKTLRSMGPVAEPALLEAAEKLEPEAAAIAVNILADVGTRNSLPFLRRALKSKNPMAREISRQTIAAIEQRHPGTDASDGGETEEKADVVKKTTTGKKPKKKPASARTEPKDEEESTDEDEEGGSSRVLDLPAVRRASGNP